MKLLFISLGCDKNLVDTEFMLGMLRDDGAVLTDDEYEADVIIINSCCFINDAKEESINTILEMAEHKKDGRLKALIVTGCLAQRYQEEIKKEIPEVDAILGTNSYEDIVNAVHRAIDGDFYQNYKTLEGLPSLRTKRTVTTGGHFAYLKLQRAATSAVLTVSFPISAAITAVFRWRSFSRRQGSLWRQAQRSLF